MKTFNLYIITAVAAAFLLAGCSKEKLSSKSNPTVVIEPVVDPIPGTGTNSNASTSAATVDLTPVSFSNFYDFAQRTLNNPTQLKVSVNLHDIGSGRYAGEVTVGYYDNGSYYRGLFRSGESINEISYNDTYRGQSDAEFNQWFTWQGNKVFHGFFQDKLGAIVLVIDKTDGVDSGDGAGVVITNVSGRVYYKNFLRTTADAPQGVERCWFVMKVGSPYYCPTFLNSKGIVNTTSALYPTDGYKLLGTFSGMNKATAFND